MGNKLGSRRHVLVDEKYTRPQGLYQLQDVDYKKLRKLILDSKLAPCYPGEDECGSDLEECPICFFYYPSINRSTCCAKGVCTECFLQMKSLNPTQSTPCPFCKSLNYAVNYRGVKTNEEKGMEQIEEQRVLEAKIRMQQRELREEEERRQKRNDGYSSSQAFWPNEVVSDTVEVPFNSCPVEAEEIVPSHGSDVAPIIRRPPSPSQNIVDESDIEELMVREAIWLSMQENASHQDLACGNITSMEQYVDQDQCLSAAVVLPAGTSSSPSGGLACAIAAIVENQQLGVLSSGNYAGRTLVCNDMSAGCSSKVIRRGGKQKIRSYSHAGSSEQLGEISLSEDAAFPTEPSVPFSAGLTHASDTLLGHQQMGGVSSGNYAGSFSACQQVPPLCSRILKNGGRRKSIIYSDTGSSKQHVDDGQNLSVDAVLATGGSLSSFDCFTSFIDPTEHCQFPEIPSGKHVGSSSATPDGPFGCNRISKRGGRRKNSTCSNAASSEHGGEDQSLSASVMFPAEASLPPYSHFACSISNHADHQQMDVLSSGNYSGSTSAYHGMALGDGFYDRNGRHQIPDDGDAAASEKCTIAVSPDEATSSTYSGLAKRHGESSYYSGTTSAYFYMLPGYSRYFNMDGRHQNQAYANAASSECYAVGDSLSTATSAVLPTATAAILPAEMLSAPSGGLSCAVAGLTGNQQTSGDFSSSNVGNTSACGNMFSGCNSFVNCDGLALQNYSCAGNPVEVLLNGQFALNSSREWGTGRELDGTEMGNGYASLTVEDPGRNTTVISQYANYAVFRPLVASILTERWEERMMLMVVSLAETRARTSATGLAWY